MGKIKIKGNSYTGTELATHQLPPSWQSVSGHLVNLFNELEKLIIWLTLTEKSATLSAVGF